MVTTENWPIDLYKQRPSFFKAARAPQVVELPEAGYLVVDGDGSPDGNAFQAAIGALYSTAYTLKFAQKRAGKDFKVPTFEGSWWIYGPDGELPKAQWHWQLFMMLPDFIGGDDVEKTTQNLATRGKGKPTGIRYERVTQGLCAQILHVGPYAEEATSMDKLQAFMAAEGLRARGPHHEVYLGDPRRAKPERLKTIVRYPVEKAPLLSSIRATSRLNRDWHLANPMPKNATPEQRIQWHLAHEAHCSCRAMPASLKAEIHRRSLLSVGTPR